MKKSIFVFSLLMVCASLGYAAVDAKLPASPQTTAYHKYKNRPKNELSKLIYLMDRFKGTGYKVLYNQMEYDSATALQQAKNYIAKHYQQENAEAWVREHAYRSAAGEIIYLHFEDGKKEILRDALVRELKTLKV